MSRRDELAQRHFPDFTTCYPDFPLKAAYGTRNALAQGYFNVDLDVVWRTVARDLPLLGAQVGNVIQALGHGNASPSS
ncbi:MAG: HepT-like ribonuclease domain-containing protein [Pseudomonadota bacterium]